MHPGQEPDGFADSRAGADRGVGVRSAPQITFVDGAPTQTNTGTGGRQTNAGLGDTILKARFFVVDDPGSNRWWPSLTPFVKLKIPTADENKNLGTGEFDGGFGIEFDRTFGHFFIFGDVSYTSMGTRQGKTCATVRARASAWDAG